MSPSPYFQTTLPHVPSNGSGDSVHAFDEFSAREGSYGQIAGRQFIELFLHGD